MILLTSSMFHVNEKAENQQTPDLITHRHASTRMFTHRIALGFSGALFTFLDDTIIAP